MCTFLKSPNIKILGKIKWRQIYYVEELKVNFTSLKFHDFPGMKKVIFYYMTFHMRVTLFSLILS